jgi:Rieske Fe-S protein
MFLSTESSPHTMRVQPTERGEMLIVLGEKHTPGVGSEARHYAALETWTREHFDVAEVAYRWSTQDNWPLDLLPYIGDLTPNSRIQVITGLKGWGMTLGTIGAEIVRDAILGQTNPYAKLYSPNRLNPKAAAKEAMLENAKVGLRFVADHLKRGEKLPVAMLRLGEGKILNFNGEKVATYRDQSGKVHGVSHICTHLGCSIRFNDAEKTWDCPCHGSRFDHTGKVIQGPAVKDLARIKL